ncbi:MAG: glycosyltransferase family 4 protein [Elusimicrobiota bacterium]
MKVVHVITRLEFGGAQHNTLYTVAHLNPALFERSLIVGKGGFLDEEAETMACSNHVRLYWIPDLHRKISPIDDWRSLWEMVKILKLEKPEIVHTHSSKAGILGRIAARICGVPTIVHTYHGFGFTPLQNWFIRNFYIALERLCARWTDALIFVSRSNKDEANRRKIGNPRSRHIIRSGIKVRDYPVALADRKRKKFSLGVGMHKSVVVSIGNFKPQKNAMDFSAVAEKVLLELPETEFLYIGDGQMRTAVEARIFARGLSSRVRLLGWRKDVAEILAVSDIFTLTSLWEGLPRALLEAMASGVAPVCYAVDGISEIIRNGENGFSAAPRDIETLSSRIIELLKNDDLRNRIGVNAKKSVTEEFDIDVMVQSQEKLYKNLSQPSDCRGV